MESFTPVTQNNFLPPEVKSTKKKKIFFGILGLVVASLIFALVWFVYLNKPAPEFLSPVVVNPGNTSENNKVQNPITGELVSTFDAASWMSLRPLGVMINNHTDARPQSGLVDADIVYEIVAEGGITRFLAFFLSTTPEKIGPVRSTREYYLVLVKELGDAMLMHIGWSPQALEAIETWPVRSLGRGGATFWRDTSLNVATEHTAYVDGKVMRETGEELGWTGNREIDSWKFKDSIDKYSVEPSASSISVDFWYKGDYSSGFNYDAATNSYLRWMGYDVSDATIPHIDRESQKQISVKNVIVQFATENAIVGDDKSRLTYDLVGSGSGLVFLDGKVIKVTWTKEERDSRTMFYDLNGNEVEFNRGKIWVSIVPDRNQNQVIYTP